MRFWSCIIIRVRGIDDTGKAEAKPHVAIDLKNDLDFFEIISTNFSKFLMTQVLVQPVPGKIGFRLETVIGIEIGGNEISGLFSKALEKRPVTTK